MEVHKYYTKDLFNSFESNHKGKSSFENYIKILWYNTANKLWTMEKVVKQTMKNIQ